MALDACVFCNCYETGKVKFPPPQPELVYVDPESGEVSLRSDEPNAEHLFYKWQESACEHGPYGKLVSHRLGNIARIGFLRNLFLNTPDRFPTLLSKVVYDGTHMCDVLSLSDVENVADEMLAVHGLHCADASYEVILRDFEECMMELVQAARKVRKPIVFA